MRASLTVLSALLCFLHQAPQSPSIPDALQLMNAVSQRYADAKSYHIEAIQELTSTNDLHRDWQKILLTAIVMPGGRFRYEGRSGYGSAILVSDGTTNWTYHADEHLYTQVPVFAAKIGKSQAVPQEEMAAQNAKLLVSQLAHLADQIESAVLLPDENIALDGHDVSCYVVRVKDDSSKSGHPDYKKEETIWVDKLRKVVVKTVVKEHTYFVLPGSNAHIPISTETTTSYAVTYLDSQEPAGTFAFVAPRDAQRVLEFPSQLADTRQSEADHFLGKPAPELYLKSSNGTVTTLSSLRGRAVFIDFWASWCAPCVALIPELARLYSEAGERGLLLMTIDSDDEPAAATRCLARFRAVWPNYHDADGSLGKAFHRHSIPLGVLVDAEGNVVFYKSGYEVSEVRAAVAELKMRRNSTTPTTPRP